MEREKARAYFENRLKARHAKLRNRHSDDEINDEQRNQLKERGIVELLSQSLPSSIFRYMDKSNSAEGQVLIGESESANEGNTSDSTYGESDVMDPTEEPNEYDETEHFSNKELEMTKMIVIQFVTDFLLQRRSTTGVFRKCETVYDR